MPVPLSKMRASRCAARLVARAVIVALAVLSSSRSSAAAPRHHEGARATRIVAEPTPRTAPTRVELFQATRIVQPQLAACLQGRARTLRLRYVLGPAGTVDQVTLLDAVPNRGTRACVLRVARALRVAPFAGAPYAFSFPFVFDTAEPAGPMGPAQSVSTPSVRRCLAQCRGSIACRLRCTQPGLR